MSFSRTLLTRGPGIITYGGGTFYTRADILSRFGPVWNPVNTSTYGQVDKFIKDRVYKLPMRLWGAWENLATLFPAYAINPQVGTSIFGNNATLLTVLGRNGDQVQYANAQVTKLANLYLGVDQDLFAADVEFTCIIGNSGANTVSNPETANAYYSLTTGNAYADNAFSKANFKRGRFTGAWAAMAGFGSIVSQKGFLIGWELDARPLTVDGYGTVDFTIGENALQGSCKAIPIGPTLAQIEAQVQAQGVQFGNLLSSVAGDLTLTSNFGSPIITLKNAGISEHGYVFGIEPLRVGEITWMTTRGFAAGVPAVVATVA